jgi:hypothetical protein
MEAQSQGANDSPMISGMTGLWIWREKYNNNRHLKAVGTLDHGRLFRSVLGHRMHNQTDLSYPN